MMSEKLKPTPGPIGWTDDQVIRFAFSVLIQGNTCDSIEIRLNKFREHEALRGIPTPKAHVPNIEEAAKVMAEAMDYPWEPMAEQGRQHMRESARKVCAALAKHKEV